MDTEPEQYLSNMFTELDYIIKPFNIGVVIALIVIVLLLAVSAMMSGSEVAFFSLSPIEKKKLKKTDTRNARMVLKLLEKPEKLLGTILVANNFVNVSVVIISAYITAGLFDFSRVPQLGFLFQIVIITFLILIFGEILPKVYASRIVLRFAKLMSFPLYYISILFKPVIFLLTSSTSLVEKRLIKKRKNISINVLSDALELAEGNIDEDRSILKGIVKFGSINVSEVMASRVDIIAIEKSTAFKTLLGVVIDSGYSRIPVYDDAFDNISGILYVKDLLPYLKENDSFKWQKLARKPYFVPESKKIDDLLKEFQLKKIHMAVVIDEYGGTSGLITMEDILEEIVGEIEDESDEIENIYTKIDKQNFIFEGKILLNDFYKILEVDEHIFNDIKGEADTLAGLILELRGELPKKNDTLNYKNFKFEIISVDDRRIIKIKVTVKNKE